MLKPLLLVFSILIATMAITAESPATAAPLSESSRKVLNQVCARVAAYPVVRGQFTQTKLIKRLNKNFNSQGRFLFSGQEGILWQVEKPFQSSMVMTKDRLVQKSASGKTSLMDSQGNLVFKRFADTLQAVFAGRLSVLEEQFSLRFQGDLTQWTITLIPLDDSVRSVIQTMEIQGDQYIRGLRLVEASGDLNVYTFSSIQDSASLSEPEQRQFSDAKSLQP